MKVLNINMYKELDKSKVYENSSLSFIFEFKSPVRRRDLASKLSKNLGKKVQWFKGVNESFNPTNDTFKLSNKYNANTKSFVFETGFMQYQDAIHTMLKTMNIVDHFGHTDDRCEVKVNVSMHEKHIESGVHISKLNKFKYLIGLNEESILNDWNTESTDRHKINQNQYFYVHAKDPYNTIISSSLVERMDPHVFNFPKSDFFGHDFSHLDEGYLTINYIGGKDYQKRKTEAVSTINSVIDRLYETLSSNYQYRTDEKRKIEKIVEEYKTVVKATKNFDTLRSNYPNLHITYDLYGYDYIIESNYQRFREKIFELLVFGGVEVADINFDNERQMIQVKDAKINKNVIMEDFEFYNCIVEADAKNCLFSNCTIKNSKLEECDIITNNYIKNSKIIECRYQGSGNEITNSYLDNDHKNMIDASLKNCLVSNGSFRISSEIDKDTVILSKNT
jgi:hypothetical protein